ncbi:ATP-binding cassette domain-containing protein [Agrococcus sp. HG114]|uniref:ATP-binding cassette domain-containing protein n=1 Tax=Agrococcus sp. HG114 TaxID=2969757 RepID=UPI00215B76A9|nr:ATP-binding cassette domain-containing protein [Agrococcus sp. HG114]MCR8669572.1 ATP-binding cassette domain-containing protein [Agrococcus sp. HG114]
MTEQAQGSAERLAQGSTEREPVLALEHVTKTFAMGGVLRRRAHTAVDDVSFTLGRNQVLGLVGESGSGKSTIGRIAIGLIRPTSGSVRVLGEDITRMRGAGLRRYRRKMQMIFQDSSNSLNPRMTLLELLMEPMRVQGLHSPKEREQRARRLADEVSLAERWLGRLPHEFSGGQRQRISIARALALEPELIVADEPVSALDVSVQATVLNLLKDIQQERQLATLFISHDMAVVEFMCDSVAVLNRGAIVERGATREVFADPQHDYTRTLLDAAPSLS